MNGEAHAVQNTLELQNRKKLAKIMIVAQVKYYNISNKAYQFWTFLILPNLQILLQCLPQLVTVRFSQSLDYLFNNWYVHF